MGFCNEKWSLYIYINKRLVRPSHILLRIGLFLECHMFVTARRQLKSCDEHEYMHGHLTNWATDHVIFCSPIINYYHVCLKQQNRIRSKVVINMNICIGHLTNCTTEHFLFCSQIITTYNLQRVFMALVCLPNYVGNKATYMSMLFKQIMEWQATFPLLLPHHPWLQMDKLHFPSCYLTPTELRKDKLHFPSCYDPPPSLWNVKIGSFSHFFLSCTKSCKSAKKIFFSIGGEYPLTWKSRSEPNTLLLLRPNTTVSNVPTSQPIYPVVIIITTHLTSPTVYHSHQYLYFFQWLLYIMTLFACIIHFICKLYEEIYNTIQKE